jgi:hypothetical protein
MDHDVDISEQILPVGEGADGHHRVEIEHGGPEPLGDILRISASGRHLVDDRRAGREALLLVAGRDDDIRTVLEKTACCSPADATVPTRDEDAPSASSWSAPGLRASPEADTESAERTDDARLEDAVDAP